MEKSLDHTDRSSDLTRIRQVYILKENKALLRWSAQELPLSFALSIGYFFGGSFFGFNFALSTFF
ncbi:hypothetical protein BDV34DRAFT_195364 [Aspergillus parasiticus]|uniref:Uncharacterized protein n=1 Tax=Aspergillus parasiticus TaxID=5067 RepID=A0A5N6DKR9_ASPPA|nr:hypothetical protein BDV34DRAFT_195364 [Aspergillus parasiticus]